MSSEHVLLVLVNSSTGMALVVWIGWLLEASKIMFPAEPLLNKELLTLPMETSPFNLGSKNYIEEGFMSNVY